jgi:hypothetical protein
VLLACAEGEQHTPSSAAELDGPIHLTHDKCPLSARSPREPARVRAGSIDRLDGGAGTPSSCMVR